MIFVEYFKYNSNACRTLKSKKERKVKMVENWKSTFGLFFGWGFCLLVAGAFSYPVVAGVGVILLLLLPYTYNAGSWFGNLKKASKLSITLLTALVAAYPAAVGYLGLDTVNIYLRIAAVASFVLGLLLFLFGLMFSIQLARE